MQTHQTAPIPARRRLTSRPGLTLAVLATLALTAPASAAVPGTMQVEGSLRTVGGMPAVDGDYILAFSLFTAENGGASIWQEGPVAAKVSGGHFAWQLGQLKPLSAAPFAGLAAAWLEVKVGTDPPLPRVPLSTVAFAFRAAVADSLACSGCLDGKHLAAGSISADRLGFPWAASLTKGGPASDLSCTGCVSVAEMKFDADIDLMGNALKAKQLVGATVTATTISAGSFVGDGSKITGLNLPKGQCKAGHVVVGIAADAQLICAKGVDPNALPADGLDEISNGVLSTEFVDVTASAKAPIGIPDNDPIGIGDTIEVPDLGLAKDVTIRATLTNSDLATVSLQLFDPENFKYLLYDKGGQGTKMSAAWPAPDKTVSGDLSTWVGKNPKGKWRLVAIDGKQTQDGTDGAIESWQVQVHTLSDKKVEAKGHLLAGKGVDFLGTEASNMRLQNATADPMPCSKDTLGLVYYNTAKHGLFICNGKTYAAFATLAMGSKDKPGPSCKAIMASGEAKGSGVYWLDPDGDAGQGAPFAAWCDMSTDGGGWTLVMKLSAGSFCYGSANWTNGNALNADKLLDATFPTAGQYDAKSVAFDALKDVETLRLHTTVAAVQVNFVKPASPRVLMTTNDVEFKAYPNYSQWKAAFGHDRGRAPIFMRAGKAVTKGNVCRTDPANTPSGCGKVCVFCYQASDGDCCPCASGSNNDVNSGIGTNSAYCGGGLANCSTNGTWSSQTLRTMVWAR